MPLNFEFLFFLKENEEAFYRTLYTVKLSILFKNTIKILYFISLNNYICA